MHHGAGERVERGGCSAASRSLLCAGVCVQGGAGGGGRARRARRLLPRPHLAPSGSAASGGGELAHGGAGVSDAHVPLPLEHQPGSRRLRGASLVASSKCMQASIAES